MAALGSLVVSLALEYASFTGGLDKSEQAALASAKRVQDTMDGIKQKAAHMAGAVAGSLMAAFTVGAFKNFIGEAINAADEMSKMAQKTGMAVEQVAGVQLAFRQAGNSAESMQTSIAKLSKNMADGNQAFAAMGINVKGTDGHLKTTRQTLGEVADKFATYADGAEKTALAQELFGKSGADLIPLLNAGGAALDEYDAMAKKLGLTLDEKTAKSAENFNDTMDLMGQGVAGIGTQIAAQLLPTLSGLAGEFFETMTSGDKLKNTADFLAGAMKGLYVVGLGVVELFKTVGGVLGGVAAATVAALSGDFRGAATILGEMRTDIGTSWKTTLAQMQAAWNTTGSAAVSAMVATQQAAKGAAPVVQKLGAAAKEAADEFAKLRDKITGKETGTDSDFIKNLAILQTAYDTRRISLQEYMDLSDKYVRSQKYMQDAEKASMQIAQAHADLRQKEADSITTWFAAQEQAATQALASAKDRVAALQAEEEAVATARDLNISLGEAIEQVTIARLKEKLATFREGSDGAEAIKREIAAREELVGLLGRKDVREREQQGWTDMWSSVDRTAHDAFTNIFEGGSNVFKKLGQTLKASVLDILYQMTVRKWIIQIGTSIFGGGFGMAANAATGGSAGGGVGNLLSGASLLGGLGTFGGGLSAGFGGLMGSMGLSATGATLGGAMSAGGIALGAGNIMGGLGTIAGALGPIALGVALIASLIKPRTYHSGGAGSYSAEGGASTGLDVLGQGLTFGVGASHYDKAAETAAVQVAKSISGLLDSTAKVFGKDAGYYAATAFADDSSKDGAWGSLIIKRLDDTIVNWADTQTSKWAPKVFADGDKGKAEYMQQLAASTKQAILSIGLPEWAQRIASSMPDSGSMEDLSAMLAQIQGYPAQLLQAYGTSRDALVNLFVQGLQSGNAQAAGQSVADTLVGSIQNAVYGQAAGQIFDIVNMGIVTPMLDAIATGASVSEALSQATIDATIKRAKDQAAVLAELFGNAEFTAALEQIRGAVGSALGQAGASIQRLPFVAQQIDTAAQDAAQAATEAANKWQQITDNLLGTRLSLAIELLRAQGRGEEALAMERTEAIKGMDAYQVGLYDANTGTRALIDSLTRMKEISEQLASELPGVVSKYLTPEQNTAAQYGSIAGDLIKSGLSGMGADELTRALTGASKDEIAQAAVAVYNMAGVTDEMRLALVRAAGGLADLKTEAEGLQRSETDAAMAALEKAVDARKALLTESITAIRAVFEAVRDNARALYGEVDSTAKGLARAGQAFIDNALSNAMLTGYLPDADALKTAIADARGGISGTQYATQFEADRDRLVLAGKLSQLQGISGKQLTEAEKQLEALDELLASSHRQLDALRGIDASVMSVEAAVAALAGAMAREKAGGGGGGGGRAGTTQTVNGADTLHGANGAQYSVKSGMGYQSGTGLPWFADTIRAAAADLVNAGNGKQVYDLIKSEGYTLSQANTILGLGEGTAEDWARAMGLPVYHQGTDYVPQTGFALLQRGERVTPAGGGGNSERLEGLVVALTAEVKRLQGVVAEGNQNTRQFADQFDNVTGGGNAIRSETVGA